MAEPCMLSGACSFGACTHAQLFPPLTAHGRCELELHPAGRGLEAERHIPNSFSIVFKCVCSAASALENWTGLSLWLMGCMSLLTFTTRGLRAFLLPEHVLIPSFSHRGLLRHQAAETCPSNRNRRRSQQQNLMFF